MDDKQQKELWEFVGSAKRQFESNKEILTELRDDVKTYHKKVDRHLTLHRYIHRGICAVFAGVVAWWKA